MKEIDSYENRIKNSRDIAKRYKEKPPNQENVDMEIISEWYSKSPLANKQSKNKNTRPIKDSEIKTAEDSSDEQSQAPLTSSKCTGQQLNKAQSRIKQCLNIILHENSSFLQRLIRVRTRPGPDGTCAKYVAEAAAASGLTSKKPNGCAGFEKTEVILRSESNFIDLVSYNSSALGAPILKASAQSPLGILASLVAPNGSIFSFRGNNFGTCGGKKYYGSMNGFGHMTAKVSDSEFCHFICQPCPALPDRFIDKIIFKVKSEYLDLFKIDKSLDSICNEVFKKSKAQLYNHSSPTKINNDKIKNVN